ncbi:MAG: fibronectin type III domain-containing protein, partial [Kineosporiaceae bacterium]
MGGRPVRLGLTPRALAAVARLVGLAWTLGGILAVGAIAWGYWSQTGVGAGTAAMATLAPPSGVTALTPVGNSVTVQWAAALAPNAGPVTGYYVRRYAGGVPSGVCASSPSSLLAAAATTCSDTGVPDGTYTYTVTAAFRTWEAESAATGAVVVQALHHFRVSGPASATAGTAMTVTVTAEDVTNTPVTGYGGSVRFTSSDPGGPVLPPDYTFVAGDNGAHTFTAGATLYTAGNRTITAADTVDPSMAGSAVVTLGAAAASRLVFSVQPGGGTGGLRWATQPRVTVQDPWANTVTSASASVTLAIATNPAGGALTCSSNPRAASSGVAAFSNCKITAAGSGYTLSASSPGLTSATSNSFTIAIGPAAKLAFTQQPGGATGGTAFVTQPVVEVRDAGGNTISGSSANVTVAIGSG